jgi:23S rRNA A1618 N6-methylase RlmF
MIIVKDNVLKNDVTFRQKTKDDIALHDFYKKEKDNTVEYCKKVFYRSLSRYYLLNFDGLKKFFAQYGYKLPYGKDKFSEFVATVITNGNKSLIVPLVYEMSELGYLDKNENDNPFITTCIYSSLTSIQNDDSVREKEMKNEEKRKVRNMLNKEITEREVDINEAASRKKMWTMITIFAVTLIILMFVFFKK